MMQPANPGQLNHLGAFGRPGLDWAGQDELFWFLTVMRNAIVLWNSMALEQAISRAKSDGVKIDDDALQHILPTLMAFHFIKKDFQKIELQTSIIGGHLSIRNQLW